MKVTGGIFHDVPPSPTPVPKVIRTRVYKLSGLRGVSYRVINMKVTVGIFNQPPRQSYQDRGT